MPTILLHLLPASVYALLGIHFWRTHRQQGPQQPLRGLRPWERIVLLGALTMHAFGLSHDMFGGGAMHFGFSYALAVMLWLALVFYWIESFFARLEGLHLLGLPLAALCALLPVIFPGSHLLTHLDSPMFRAHLLMAMLAYSLFTLAALHAVLMAVAERSLRKGRLSRAVLSLPPLMTMETLLFRLVLIAFILLTLTLVSGIFFSEKIFGQPLRFDHKTLFAIGSWLIFAALLVGRKWYGWRGRTALRWTLSGFVALLLAYVGSRFVLEVVLGRA